MRIAQKAYGSDHVFTGRVRLSMPGLFLLVLFCRSPLETAHAQGLPYIQGHGNPVINSIAGPCDDPSTAPALMEALHLVCGREPVEGLNDRVRNGIIIGFVGGFVRQDDVNHPEVLFATYLRERYGSAVHAKIFGNHDGSKALEDILALLKKDDQSFSPSRKPGRIILYGHSWGASQTLALARELQRRGIPVALTIQIDSVKKIGSRQDDRMVPANVAKAVNFYQRKGLTPGQPRIVAADATQTKILGNFHMTYEGHHINVDNYRWLSRVFNKHHHEIENDPWVWNQVVTLIDSELLMTNAEIQAASSKE
jgi:pimeloyl-ACP methyl ester carboxylesterase